MNPWNYYPKVCPRVPSYIRNIRSRRVSTYLRGLLSDRKHVALAWRILHGCLFCGAFRGRIRPTLPLSDRCCPRPCCSDTPETLTHLFLTCPVSSRVISWVCDFWVAVTRGSPPLATAAVFLADDQHIWDPGTSFRDLWTRIRLNTLYAIWVAANRRRGGVVSNPASIVARIIFSLRGSMSRDFLRTHEDIRLHAGVLSDWLRGRDSAISLDHFQSLWGPPGVNYILLPSAIPNQPPSLQILLSCTHPIPVPQGGEN